MTLWYATESQESDDSVQRTAGTKARDDLESILDGLGWLPLPICTVGGRASRGPLGSVFGHLVAARLWNRSLSMASPGDAVLVQLPAVNHTMALGPVLSRHRSRGVRMVAFLHDLESIRAALRPDGSWLSRRRAVAEEAGPLEVSDAVISHNDRMTDLLVSGLGLDSSKVVPLGIFDYLADGGFGRGRFAPDSPVVVCGTLRRHKAGYAYKLPDCPDFNLYGVGYEAEGRNNVHYWGSFPPAELPSVVGGSFGLVWDGDSADTCAGAYGEYLRVNNPHKTSMYLSMGLPVAIWDEAALAPFILENGAGIAISSIGDLGSVIESVSEAEYERMRKSAELVGARVRAGFYTEAALLEALKIIGRQ